MARKTPLILSTLTMAICSFTSMPAWANTSSYSTTGPWTFEEMMSLEKEVQATIDEVCPYEYYTLRCAYRYTDDRTRENPIYGRLLSFEGAQFHILLIDAEPKNGKNHIEYYFESENSIEKYSSKPKSEIDPSTGNTIKYFDKSLFTHIISKLYIYQTEEGHADAPSNKDSFMEMLSAPYTRMLYSGIKPDSSESLLPLDQKGALEINEVSFDPIYKKRINYAFEDETGKIHSFSTLLTDCHQGGDTCKMQYGVDSPFPSLVNKPTYEEGYTAGYNDGYNEGNSTGYNTGYSEGNEAGHNTGYTEGKNDGYEEGHIAGKQEGYDAGFDEGHTAGIQEGYEIGYENGYQDGLMRGEDRGFNQGFFEGQNIGYEEGYDDGQRIGQDEGHDAGYAEGYHDGFLAGQADGATNRATNGEGQDSQDDSTDLNNTSDQNNIASQVPQTNQSVNDSNQSAHLETTTLLASSSKITPNTGYQTQENNSSVEFPWWLGVVFAIGIATIIWLFIPNRKNRQKK